MAMSKLQCVSKATLIGALSIGNYTGMRGTKPDCVPEQHDIGIGFAGNTGVAAVAYSQQ